MWIKFTGQAGKRGIVNLDKIACAVEYPEGNCTLTLADGSVIIAVEPFDDIMEKITGIKKLQTSWIENGSELNDLKTGQPKTGQ